MHINEFLCKHSADKYAEKLWGRARSLANSFVKDISMWLTSQIRVKSKLNVINMMLFW